MFKVYGGESLFLAIIADQLLSTQFVTVTRPRLKIYYNI